ncbi:MraY family glycosyltransferase [Xylanivirga thermophila]|uniref:MraY family glycosyltransferase n=1 Tax=Xylanivirga thermophila TaxID=2496273 RepID=UPI00101B9121|nr:MraY family glycosyltransferase [Xylanivirga thermophila]
MGIYIAFIVSILISMDYTIDIQRLIIYSGLMLVVGILDDIKDIKAIYKLALETISALLAVLSGVMLHTIPDGMWWSSFVNVTISIVWMVGITNAVNIVDGLDGLAGGIAFIGSCAFLAIFMIYDYAMLSQLALIFMGAILGFLIYNFYPAKLFMGDGGSLFLGFILSIFSIIYINTDKSDTSVWVPIVILAVPIFETGSSMLRRFLNGKSMVAADDGHIHYRLIKKGFSPVAAVSIIYAWAVLSGMLGVLIAIQNLLPLALFIIICLIAIGVRLYI